jgi:tRNA(Ile)-lysidine synthetase-like protein
MKYILAVSGGVDSVVLLDMLARKKEHEVIVAHFDHGIREESAVDARFVKALALRYGVTFESKREELGSNSSEAMARERRYNFLREVASKYSATIATAHHQDDLIETIVINLIRGTGWRGLAVLNDKTIKRPLLHYTKHNIYEYALKNNLEWVEDETNHSNVYLRNRVRPRAARLNLSIRQRLVELWRQQQQLATTIDELATRLPMVSRYFMTMIDDAVAIELLRAELGQKGLSLTRPQRQRLLYAIKTAKPGDQFEAGQGVTVNFTLREYVVN